MRAGMTRMNVGSPKNIALSSYGTDLYFTAFGGKKV
jgi:hypothetical protein